MSFFGLRFLSNQARKHNQISYENGNCSDYFVFFFNDFIKIELVILAAMYFFSKDFF